MEPVIVFLALFATIFAVSYVFLTTRNRERLALIEKGVDASLFATKGMKFSIAKFILNIALLFVGLGIGVIMGQYLPQWMDIHKEPATAAMLFIFGGLALIVGFFLTRHIEKTDNN